MRKKILNYKFYQKIILVIDSLASINAVGIN